MPQVTGNVFAIGGGVVPYASVTVLDGNFERTGEGTRANSSGAFSLFIDPVNEPYAMEFSSVGYKPKVVPLSSWQNGATINLEANVVTNQGVTVYSVPKKPFPFWVLAVPVALYAMDSKKKKVSGIGKVEANTVLMVGGGLIGLTVINKILVSLGIAKGKGGQAVQNEITNPYSPWKPAYYKALPGGTQYLSLTEAGGNNFSSTIYNAFTLFKDNFDAIMGVFNQLQAKTQVSVLSEYFFKKYDRDLLTFLTDGGGILPWDGLSDSQFKTITDYVSNLPATGF
jgi:hypothetical protein